MISGVAAGFLLIGELGSLANFITPTYSLSACLKGATKRLMHRSNYRRYSITSARASSEGVLRPSAFGSNRFPDEDVLT
jgi:hypothetical protein